MVEAIDVDGGVVGSAELPASGEASWAGTWIPPGLGEIRFRITEPGLSAIAGATMASIEVGRPDDELRDSDADHEFITALAEETGGLVHDLNGADSVLDRIYDALPRRAIVTEQPIRERIWTSPFFFIMLLSLATAEWVGRRLIRLD
jgi:hypothetical protein